MKFLIFSLSLLGTTLSAATNSLIGYEVDNATQTNRPVTLGRVFADSDAIANCPQPVIDSTPIASGSWQADVRNRWASGNVKFAVISFYQTFSASSSHTLTFQNATCNNVGLTYTQMKNFNSGGSGWGASLEVTANSITQTANAATILANTDPTAAIEGGNQILLSGPVVTQVLVQDITSSTAYDVGFKDKKYTALNVAQTASSANTTLSVFDASDIVALGLPTVVTVSALNGTGAELETVTACSGNSCTVTRAATPLAHSITSGAVALVASNSQTSQIEAAPSLAYKSLHPVFILSFYPGPNYSASTCSDTYCGVKIDYIIENDLEGRKQDQTFSTVFKSGSALSQVGTLASFTMYPHSRLIQTYWSGTAPGVVRWDVNFPYLISTQFLPNLDQNVKVNPSSDYTNFSGSDRGLMSGTCRVSGSLCLTTNSNDPYMAKDFSANDEFKLIRRPETEWLYNMSASTSIDGNTCGTANSACAKAWQMLTGEVGVIDNTLAASVNRGGYWNAPSFFNVHYRDTRVSPNTYYCPTQAGVNALPTDSCGTATGYNSTFGRPISVYAHPTDRQSSYTTGVSQIPTIGLITNGGWVIQDTSHLPDWSYLAYLITGDYYYLEEEFFLASFVPTTFNTANDMFSKNGFFAYVNPNISMVERSWAGGMEPITRASVIAPDNDFDGNPNQYKNYFTSLLKSNLTIACGYMDLDCSSEGIKPTTVCGGSECGTSTCPATGSQNRYEWARCTVGQAKTVAGYGVKPPLHLFVTGNCHPNTTYVQSSLATATRSQWFEGYTGSLLGHMRELGLPVVTISTDFWKALTEQIGEGMNGSTFNKYAWSYTNYGIKNGGNTCSSTSVEVGHNTDAFFTAWSQVLASEVSAIQTVATFDHGATTALFNYNCLDHGRGYVNRASHSFAAAYQITSADANCAGGVCNALTEWTTFVGPSFPHFQQVPADGQSHACVGDQQITYALQPRALTNCTITASSPLTSCIKNSSCSRTITTIGCTAPSFATTGTVPTGMSINSSTGILSGTPTAAGDFNFNVNITDANGNPSQGYLLSITPGIAITPSPIPNGGMGIAYSQQMSASGGTGPYTWLLVNGDTPNLSISSGGLITGTPTIPGTYIFTIQATDSIGAIGTLAVTMGININITIQGTITIKGNVISVQ